MTNLFQAAGLEEEAPRPLADRLRPKRLAEVVGQSHLVGPEGTLTRALKSGRLQSMILWGPPGTGKTTVARLLADETRLGFEQLSAIFSGVQDLRKAFDRAKSRRETGKGTLLFIDEITASTAHSRTASCRTWRTAPSRSSVPPPRTPPSSSTARS